MINICYNTATKDMFKFKKCVITLIAPTCQSVHKFEAVESLSSYPIAHRSITSYPSQLTLTSTHIYRVSSQERHLGNSMSGHQLCCCNHNGIPVCLLDVFFICILIFSLICQLQTGVQCTVVLTGMDERIKHQILFASITNFCIKNSIFAT